MTIGIDIGGTTIHFGLINGSGLVGKHTVPSFGQGWSLQRTLDYLLEETARVFNDTVTGIGIGVPTLVDPTKGIVYQAANIPSWETVRLKEVVENRFSVPVSVNNDSNCFALGAAASLEKQYRVLAGVTLGTGLGVGVVLDGRLYDGPHCGVGEIGALPYEGLDYEAFCSKKFFHARGVDPMGAAEAAKAGDREALELFREFGVHLGTFLSVVMFAYDPDCIVLGGGIAHSFPLFMDSMWDTLREKYPYRKNLEDLSILAMPEEEIALVGAASL